MNDRTCAFCGVLESRHEDSPIACDHFLPEEEPVPYTPSEHAKMEERYQEWRATWR